MRQLRRLAADRTGAAAAEMALVLPFLAALMFGSFELGNFLLSEHVVQKGVRDAARYAARLPMTQYPGCAPSAAAETQIQRVARTGQPDGQTVRLYGWTADNTTSVTMTCDTSGTYTGLYAEFPDGVPVVTVSAAVPYEPFFGGLSFAGTMMLNATSQAAVFGA